jgi:energy-coupling factor transporter ATP-binding protein EcfA2
MRITGVEIANYRGFAGDSFRLSLEHGENLLVYGENGAGKSSFYNTLNDFLYAASNKNANIVQRRNRDNLAGEPAVRISTTTTPVTEWTTTVRGQDADNWRVLNDGKGFLDYRLLLRFYNAPQDGLGRIELFDLLLKGMLANHRLEIPGTPTFLSEWQAIKHKKNFYLDRRGRMELQQRVSRFNTAFKEASVKLATRASALLHDFDPSIAIAFIPERDANFTWYPKHVNDPDFFAEITRPDRASITDYHETFNEARLSAMAICLFFAAMETRPIDGPRLLVLDDVLIGLDMGNRRKVINLVQRLFRNWQIIILTYHKAWFEVLKSRIKVGSWGGHAWCSIILRPEKCRQSGLVTIKYDESGTALETATLCLERRDYKAAAVYARTAFEIVLHKHADRLHISVQFKEDRLKLDTDDFLNPFEIKFDHLVDPLKKAQIQGLVAELRFIRRTVLNAFAHADEISEDEIVGEVDHGIEVVRQFEAFLDSLRQDDFAKTVSDVKPAVPELLMLARRQAAAGNHKSAGHAMAQATASFVAEYAESICLSIPFRRSPSVNNLFRALFPEDAMDASEKRAFRPLIPYFFGSYEPRDFNRSLFDEAIRLILHTAYGKLLHILAKREQALQTQEHPETGPA